MEIAALILSVIALLCSGGCLVIMLAKNYFSSHTVQLQPVDPFKDMFPSEIGKPKMDPYRDLDESIMMDQEEIDALKGRKAKFDV